MKTPIPRCLGEEGSTVLAASRWPIKPLCVEGNTEKQTQHRLLTTSKGTVLASPLFSSVSGEQDDGRKVEILS
jgi:hypothetical protein